MCGLINLLKAGAKRLARGRPRAERIVAYVCDTLLPTEFYGEPGAARPRHGVVDGRARHARQLARRRRARGCWLAWQRPVGRGTACGCRAQADARLSMCWARPLTPLGYTGPVLGITMVVTQSVNELLGKG
jgi:hypothetical protein